MNVPGVIPNDGSGAPTEPCGAVTPRWRALLLGKCTFRFNIKCRRTVRVPQPPSRLNPLGYAYH
jgi:hypothetical protein